VYNQSRRRQVVMKKSYRILAAQSDESNEGWIWFKDPKIPTRTIVKVRNTRTGHVVYCQSRQIDDNFVMQYDAGAQRQKIKGEVNEVLVISAWYRDALGGFETTCRSGKPVELEITPARVRVDFGGWGSLRAACHQPDIAVRVGTRLGVLGTWLGLVGLMAVLLEITGLDIVCRAYSLLAVSVVFAIPCIMVCRGVRHA